MLKPAIIALALLTATSPALAKAQKLPFVGTRYFNFAGGMGTEESITITKKGNVTIKIYGKSSTGVLYKANTKTLSQWMAVLITIKSKATKSICLMKIKSLSTPVMALA